MLEKKVNRKTASCDPRAACYLLSVLSDQLSIPCRSNWLRQQFGNIAMGNIAMGNIAIWQCLWPVPAFARGATGFQ